MCGTENVEIRAYPSGHATISYDFGKYGEAVARNLEKIPAFGKEVKRHIMLPDGNIGFENWWEERPQNNKVIFAFKGAAGLEPLIGMSSEWPILGIPLPRILRKYADAGMFLDINGKLSLVGDAHRNAISVEKNLGTHS
jgi:hypothetical protein